MLRRDYLLKLIQDLFASIEALLEGEGDAVGRQREIEALYATFGKDKNFFRQAEEADIVAAVAEAAAESQGVAADQLSAQDIEQRLELMAALLYADFKVSNLSPGLRKDVALRSLAIYEKVVASSETFSQERQERIDELRGFLSAVSDGRYSNQKTFQSRVD